MSKHLYVAGDPIRDVYYIGKRIGPKFITNNIIKRFGAAANTFLNAKSICTDSDIEVQHLWSLRSEGLPSLSRLVNKNEVEVEFWPILESKKTTMIDSFHTFNEHLLDILARDKSSINGLILSDYNKGAVNRLHPDFQAVYNEVEWDFIVVDSRYRTIDTTLLQNAKLKILHATEAEYDYLWASKHFDYVYWTKGEKDIWVGSLNASKYPVDWQILKVPPTIPVDTIGAGDTFTAAVGSHIMHHWSDGVTADQLVDAGKFAIDCCQEVIKVQYAAITTKRIKDT